MKKSVLALAACVAGIASGAVPAPWTPVTAKDGIVSVWGREYAFVVQRMDRLSMPERRLLTPRGRS